MNVGIISALSVAIMLAVATPAMAQEMPKEVVAGLKSAHQALKDQVETGEISKTEAQEQWQILIEDARSEVGSYYAGRYEDVSTKVADLRETNPELAASLEERVGAVVERRAQYKQERSEIKAQVEAGTLTREEAQVARTEARDGFSSEVKADLSAYRQERATNKAERRNAIDDQRETNVETRTGMREENVENRLNTRSDNVDARTDAIDEAFAPESAKLEARSDARLEARDENVETRTETRDENVETRLDTRNENVETRVDNREERRDNILQ